MLDFFFAALPIVLLIFAMTKPRPLPSPAAFALAAALAATVAILLITRIPSLGLRPWLTASDPHLTVPIGPLGILTVSPSLVVALRGILGQDRHWNHAVLYVPSLIPFVLGALGSFFSGSTTISNLTFGGIQASIAADLGMEPTILLALQCAGAAMGNIICIHNIVSVCAVLSLTGVEGRILEDALPIVGVYGLILVVTAFFL